MLFSATERGVNLLDLEIFEGQKVSIDRISYRI